MSNSTILVSISCCTYNHGHYIRQCLEGFVTQHTTFKFEVLVHDDASTDDTVAVIREYEIKYPEIIKPIYETENQYSKRDGTISRIQRSRARGKYFAYCEGDDYWTDRFKLQKQIDFLEANPDYGMCYARVRNFVQKSGKFKNIFGTDFRTFENLINANTVPTLTVVVRKDLLERYHTEIKPEEKKWLMGDFPQWLWFSKNSNIKFFTDIFGVYRILDNSASHTSDVGKVVLFEKSSYDIKNFFLKLYGYKCEDIVVPFDEHLVLAHLYMRHGMREKATSEFRQVKERNLKIVIFNFFCGNSLFFQLLTWYYRFRYGR